MKGFVFTEFLEMVEDMFGYDIADKIINEDKLASKGVYTSIGTYNHSEMFLLIGNLSKETNIEVSELLYVYGKYLLSVFYKNYRSFFDEVDDAFSFLSQVDGYIHVEVIKLYPDAELPKFVIKDKEDSMTMLYQSSRRMSDFAVGLIEGTLEHYKEEATIKKELIDEHGEEVLITIEKSKNG